MKILIIDDNPDIRNLIKVILRPYDIDVLLADSGKAGFEVLEKEDIELIILDIIMPDMDGFEVCKTLKGDPQTAEIPVIFLSVKDETTSLVSGLKLGAVDYISKPFHQDEFIARIKVHLALHESRTLLRSRLEENKQLIHILSHDLKNPIGCAQSFVELMNEDPDNTEEYMDYIKLSLEQGLQIIDLVRHFMAIKDKKAKLELKKRNLRQLIDIALSIIMNKAREKDISVDVNVDSGIYIEVDEVSFINSVLNNLMTNAIKFSFPGSVIEINAEQIPGGKNGQDPGLEKDLIRICVVDQGMGMPEDIRQNLFDLKKSVSRSGTEGELGTGFGMPLVKKFVEAYGGTIEILSVEKKEGRDNHGTTAVISL
ncbi:MAG: hybrid sensor histidine kinase/response regulator [Desulfobacter sp.]